MGSYQLAMARAGRGDMELMAEALAVADLVGDRSMVARVLGNMSFLMARADNPILVDLFLEKSIEVAREAHDPLTMAVGLTNMSSGIIGADVPRALGLLDEAVESTRRLGNVEWISLAHANRTLALQLIGRWDEVVAAPALRADAVRPRRHGRRTGRDGADGAGPGSRLGPGHEGRAPRADRRLLAPRRGAGAVARPRPGGGSSASARPSRRPRTSTASATTSM